MEFDAYRSDLEFYSSAPQTEVNLSKQRETEESFTKQKQDFEKLRSDVQIKLKFLDENRVTNDNIKVSYLNHHKLPYTINTTLLIRMMFFSI